MRFACQLSVDRNVKLWSIDSRACNKTFPGRHRRAVCGQQCYLEMAPSCWPRLQTESSSSGASIAGHASIPSLAAMDVVCSQQYYLEMASLCWPRLLTDTSSFGASCAGMHSNLRRPWMSGEVSRICWSWRILCVPCFVYMCSESETTLPCLVQSVSMLEWIFSQ